MANVHPPYTKAFLFFYIRLFSLPISNTVLPPFLVRCKSVPKNRRNWELHGICKGIT